MRTRTVKQVDREIKRLEKRLKQLKQDRELLALGIEPRNQLSIFDELLRETHKEPKGPKQLLLV